MKLIADSGSTKTEWRISENDNINSYSGKGLNPLYLEHDQILIELENVFGVKKPSPEEIHFYGAGVTSIEMKEKIKIAFREFFGKDADISVQDDLLGAARALFGDGTGIACIMGTGSNSCFYEHGKIKTKIPALGYVLGDEGSGTDIGKRFLNKLLKKGFSKELSEVISLNGEFSVDEVIDNVYRKPLANEYLASLTRTIKKYEDQNEIREIISEAFISFIDKNISRYENFSSAGVGFVGSVAFHFREILMDCTEMRGIRIAAIIDKPVDELMKYHIKKTNKE